jgi:signal transduction histidine kinase
MRRDVVPGSTFLSRHAASMLQRPVVAIFIAVLTPTILLLALQAWGGAIDLRETLARTTLGRAAQIMQDVDGELLGDVRALELLASSPPLDRPERAAASAALQRARSLHQDWRALALVDASGAIAQFDGDAPLRPQVTRAPRQSATAMIGDIQPAEEGAPLIPLTVPVARQNQARFTLVALKAPAVFQTMVQRRLPADVVAAIVDRQGRFIARTLRYQERLGHFASHYVLDAVRKGGDGLYRGETLEGLDNYSGYHSSLLSGWSAHIAVSASLFDAPRSRTQVLAAAALVISLLLLALLARLVLDDLRARRLAADRLAQGEKMQALGQLTGGIAHDFNNLLAAVIGSLEIVKRQTSGNEKAQRFADNALAAARRGAKLTAQLLAFSRVQRLRVESVDVSAMLEEVAPLLNQSVGPEIVVQMTVADDARFVQCDRVQLEVALVNLCINARDAMANGGVVRIHAQRAASELTSDLPRAAYIDLLVADSGGGMDEATRQRAMEPFFTTKPSGKGTGLGLSQVYGTVQQSGGAVLIESTPGAGTNVHLLLLQGDPVVAQAPPSPALADRLALRLLLVDDDEAVRSTLAEQLRSRGHRVEAFAAPEAALQRLDDTNFDLCISDYAMPGMSGVDLARALAERREAPPILLISGHPDSAAIATLPNISVLPKPFEIDELERRMAAVVERAKPRA